MATARPPNRPEDRWHKDSRFWRMVPWIIVLSFGLTVYLKDPITWVAVIPILAGGAAAQTTVRHHHDGRARTARQEEDLP